MLFTTHLIAGAAVGGLTGNPYLAFVSGSILHQLLDWIPHYDPESIFNEKKEPWELTARQWFISVFDVVVGIGFLILIWFSTDRSIGIFWGAFGGVLPDLIDKLPYVSKPIRRTKFGKIFNQIHSKFHISLRLNQAIFGLGIQIMIIMISMWVLIGNRLI